MQRWHKGSVSIAWRNHSGDIDASVAHRRRQTVTQAQRLDWRNNNGDASAAYRRKRSVSKTQQQWQREICAYITIIIKYHINRAMADDWRLEFWRRGLVLHLECMVGKVAHNYKWNMHRIIIIVPIYIYIYIYIRTYAVAYIEEATTTVTQGQRLDWRNHNGDASATYRWTWLHQQDLWT